MFCPYSSKKYDGACALNQHLFLCPHAWNIQSNICFCLFFSYYEERLVTKLYFYFWEQSMHNAHKRGSKKNKNASCIVSA